MTRREEIYEASCECYNDYIDVVMSMQMLLRMLLLKAQNGQTRQ